MSARPTPADLSDESRYEPVWAVEHHAIAQALSPFIWRRSKVSAVYIAANLGAFAVVAASWIRSRAGLIDGFPTLCLEMVSGYLLLLPTHEWVHALAYKSLGADRVVVKYQWRTLTAYCAADRFVIDRRGLMLVCLAPFVILNPPLLATVWTLPGTWGLAASGAFLLHVGACSGDFGLANWLGRSGRGRIFSYDDVSRSVTYFYSPREDA